jgi:hypothetical protein
MLSPDYADQPREPDSLQSGPEPEWRGRGADEAELIGHQAQQIGKAANFPARMKAGAGGRRTGPSVL